MELFPTVLEAYGETASIENFEFFIVGIDLNPVLSLEAAWKLNLIKRI